MPTSEYKTQAQSLIKWIKETTQELTEINTKNLSTPKELIEYMTMCLSYKTRINAIKADVATPYLNDETLAFEKGAITGDLKQYQYNNKHKVECKESLEFMVKVERLSSTLSHFLDAFKSISFMIGQEMKYQNYTE